MPDYVSMTEMNGLIPAAFLVQALDDDQDGNADAQAWGDVLSQVHKSINGPLSVRYTTPFTNPLPPIVVECAPIFAAELLYSRRGTSEENNPWTKRAKELRAKLELVAKGELPLTPEIKRTAQSAAAITERAATTGTRRPRAV
jgi:phage gp36-like protein